MPDYLTRQQVADLMGWSRPATIDVYLARGAMPGPDGYLGRTPYWKRSTIDRWAATRRGRGRPVTSTTARNQRRRKPPLQDDHAAESHPG